MSTLNQIANWKSANNPLEHVCGGDSISPTIIARGMDDNAQMVLYSPELKDTTNVRDKYMKQVEPCAYDEQNGYLRNDGTVGSLTTDGSSPKHNNRIVEPIVYDDYNGRIRADQDTIGCITTNFGNDAPRNAQKIIEPKLVGGFGDMKSNGGTQYYQQDRVYDGDEIAMCHPASITGGSYNYQVQDYRVRKLTECECFRLQGVKDEDFERVRANQSKSSCYHLAGDSITVSVLMALFGEMLDIDWRASVDELVDTLCSYDK